MLDTESTLRSSEAGQVDLDEIIGTFVPIQESSMAFCSWELIFLMPFHKNTLYIEILKTVDEK